jgi:hypothetical protein
MLASGRLAGRGVAALKDWDGEEAIEIA